MSPRRSAEAKRPLAHTLGQANRKSVRVCVCLEAANTPVSMSAPLAHRQPGGRRSDPKRSGGTKPRTKKK